MQNKKDINKDAKTSFNSQSPAYKAAFIGLFSAFAIIISYIESLIPINIGIPGIKPGFANIVIIIVLYAMNIKSAAMINLIRITIIGIMFGNVLSISFSCAGAVLSMFVMVWIKKIKGVSMIGASVCGGVAHNLGQIAAAATITTVYSLLYYIPFLIIGGIITGIIVGIAADIIYTRVIKRLEDFS